MCGLYKEGGGDSKTDFLVINALNYRLINKMKKNSSNKKIPFLLIMLLQTLVLFSQKLSDVNEFSISEKVYLHTDKDSYVAGEIIWFKIYTVDGNNNQLNTSSKILYIELIDRNGLSVLQAKIENNNNQNGGSGSFYLPLTLKSDNYVVRAYTSWMKNLGSSFFFEKTIAVVNVIKSGLGKIEKSSEKDLLINFFPEGGRFVVGIQTRVGFKITNRNGHGITGKGGIIDNNGDTIVKFASLHKGIGSFEFKPLTIKGYKPFIVMDDNKIKMTELPPILPQGYILNVKETTDTNYTIRIAAQTKLQAERMFLVVHSASVFKYSYSAVVLAGSDYHLNLSKSKLGAGINNITLFNEDGYPVCERLIFNRDFNINNIDFNINKNVIKIRDEVCLSIMEKKAEQLNLDSGSYSFAVYKIGDNDESNNMNILNYLLLTSELRGEIEAPDFYFSKSVDKKTLLLATENLMLTHGWRRFNISTGNQLEKKHSLPELKSHIISGQVVNTVTGDFVAGARCYLTIPGIPYGLYYSQSDSNGIVHFEVFDYYGPGEIIPQVWIEDKNNYQINIFNPFSEEGLSFDIKPIIIDTTQHDAILNEGIAMQAQNIYWNDSLGRYAAPELLDTLPFFGKSEFTYLLDDYKRFSTMEEVLREYVTPITLSAQASGLQVRIFNDLTKETYRRNAFVMVDGVPLRNYDRVVTYDPLKIKKIRIVPRKFIIGAEIYLGIVSFESYPGRFDAFELDSALVAIDYEGLKLKRQFYAPVYDDKNIDSRMPDMRSTLMWMPNIDFGKQKSLCFYTSDLTGKFVAVLEGMTKDGQPIVAKTYFEVE